MLATQRRCSGTCSRAPDLQIVAPETAAADPAAHQDGETSLKIPRRLTSRTVTGQQRPQHTMAARSATDTGAAPPGGWTACPRLLAVGSALERAFFCSTHPVHSAGVSSGGSHRAHAARVLCWCLASTPPVTAHHSSPTGSGAAGCVRGSVMRKIVPPAGARR